MKKGLNNLVGEVVKHKKFGRCEVVKVINGEQGKIMCKIIETGDTKTLVFSKQFFHDVSSYETKDVELKVLKKQIHKEIDYKRFRNHPLIKEIDRKEHGFRSAPITLEDSEDDVEGDSQ